jgi:hypothetical protein
MFKSVVMAMGGGSSSVVLQHHSTPRGKQSPVQIQSMKLKYAKSHSRRGGWKWM